LDGRKWIPKQTVVGVETGVSTKMGMDELALENVEPLEPVFWGFGFKNMKASPRIRSWSRTVDWDQIK
jgi:hypothetical protein